MKPAKFPEANKVLTRPLDCANDVQDLHVWSDGEHCVSCWKMSWRDRIRVLFTGTVWFWAMGRTHPPILLEAEAPKWGEGTSEEAAQMDAEPYLIWSNEHKCWWAADSKGYRTKLEDAGRYSREDALGICTGARGGRQYNDNPSEVPILLSDARVFWTDDKEEWAIARRNFREDRERDMLRAYGVILDEEDSA